MQIFQLIFCYFYKQSFEYKPVSASVFSTTIFYLKEEVVNGKSQEKDPKVWKFRVFFLSLHMKT